MKAKARKTVSKAVVKQRGGSSTVGADFSSTKYLQSKFKKDGSLKKFKPISERKFNRVSKRFAKQKGSEGLVYDNGQVTIKGSGRNPRKSVSKRYKMGGAAEMAKKMKPYSYGGHVVPGMFGK